MKANNKKMNSRQLEDGLGKVILLLIGLYVFNLVIAFLLPMIVPVEWLIFSMKHYSWAGQLLFGITIYWLVKENKMISGHIAVLSAVLPIFGGLFYLLTLIKFEKVNEGQEF